MATITDSNGNVTYVTINNVESPEDLAERIASTVDAKKKRGKSKKFHYERKVLSAMVKKEWVDSLLQDFKNPTEAINYLVEQYIKNKGN